MSRCNVIMIFSPDKSRMLMCRRTREPFLGKYNMVGGHIEPGESDDEAAYRELFEETGITKDDVRLVHAMDFFYRFEDFEMQVYAGRLKREIEPVGEENPLLWLAVKENYFDYSRFAGNGSIGHLLIEVLESGILDEDPGSAAAG